MALLDSISNYYMQITQLTAWESFLIIAIIFTLLAWLMPGKSDQPLFHKSMINDVIYWFAAQPLIYSYVIQFLIVGVVATGLYSQHDMQGVFTQGTAPLNTLPILIQALLILLIIDCIQYWTHRLFHTRYFWKFHAIHHAPRHVDWLTCVRFHPVNMIIHSSCVYLIVALMGFSPIAWAILIPFNMFYSPLVHANVNWSYGRFRRLLASPMFHRWHHTHREEGGNKNFAPTFPFLDMLFGTYYDPKGKKPEVFGTPNDPVPDHIPGQLLYPFASLLKKESS